MVSSGSCRENVVVRGVEREREREKENGRMIVVMVVKNGMVVMGLFLLPFLIFSMVPCLMGLEVRMEEANQVRREGVDQWVERYAIMAVSKATVAKEREEDGVVYDVTLSPHFRGITAQALRVSVPNLVRNGVVFNEVAIPAGTFLANIGLEGEGEEKSEAEESTLALLIYRKIYNFTVYSLPPGYSFAGPVIGVLPYSHTRPRLLTLTASPLLGTPILFRIPLTKQIDSPSDQAFVCAYFSPNGSVSFGNLTALPNVCQSDNLGSDVSIVLPYSFQPEDKNFSSLSTPGSISTSSFFPHDRAGSSGPSSQAWKAIVATTCTALFALASVFVIVRTNALERARVAILHRFGNQEEILHLSLFGSSRFPEAGSVRTRAVIEDSYSAPIS